MSAKEMFEKLGYELIYDNETSLTYYAKHFISDTQYIDFDKKMKAVECCNKSDSPFSPVESMPINIKELQAINKQVEELG